MLPLLSLALVLVAHVQAERFRGSPRIWRRDGISGNSTAFTNSSTTTTTTTTPLTSSSTSTLTATSILTSSNATSLEDLVPTSAPTSPLNTTTTSPGPTCAGSVTYTGSVYPTVFITVTQGFDVTVTASNASVTESATLITPLPACEATVVSPGGTFAPLDTAGATPIATIAVSTITFLINSPVAAQPTAAASTSQGPSPASGPGQPHPKPQVNQSVGVPGQATPEPPAAQESSEPAQSTSYSTIFSTLLASAPYTSTVVITKKTPVTVVVPPSSNPPVFQSVAPTTSSFTPGTSHVNIPGDGGSTKPAKTNGPAPAQSSNPGAPAVPQAGNTIAPAPNSPAAQAQPGKPAPATTINSVPVAVGASSVFVGTEAVAVPTTGAATVRAGGQLFTVKASEIIASGTTVAFGSVEAAQLASSVAPVQVTAAPGVIVTVQGTTAVVAGTTYRIGSGASSTVVTVSGQKITLGPSGVILPSTTVPAGAVTPAPMVVETAAGLTFSVDATEVVVAGTTYRIGSGAPTIHTTVSGKSLSIGPGGVGVGSSTTLKPTTVTPGTSTASADTGVQTGAASSHHHQNAFLFSELFGWLLMVFGGLLI